MKKWHVTCCIIVTHLLSAQSPDCNCKTVFNQLTHKIETEYPGFSAKTKDTAAYRLFKQKLSEETVKANSAPCPQLLKTYTDFFKDPHLWAGANGVPFTATSTISSVGTINLDITDFKNKIGRTKDAYEGIWSNGQYTFGIKKTNANEYTGFIIDSKYTEWKPGDIKFKLYTTGAFEYYLLDRTLKTGDFKLIDKSILHLEDVSVALVKQTPFPELNKEQLETRLKGLDGFYFKKVTTKTSILKLPSFEYQYLKTIDSLLEQNKSLLEESENLIIDLRGNPGGTTDAYQKLLPYISGKSIRHTGTEFLATQTYIDNLEAYKKTLAPNTPVAEIDNYIKKLKDNLGHFVTRDEIGNVGDYTEQITVASKSPRQIVILANKLTGSSAEYFLFIAKQSKKVKVLGKPSYGALDYGNAYLSHLECSGYQVSLPTYRALRLPDYPIDNIGIQPDIYLDKSVQDWISFAIDYLEN
ncbi:S41 family peptidase [Flavobacterium silvaticum]|uniref:Tail specific protease domain-containing protein n=1 Tax=Flavobacterium silvaticum TaxID=1852020 RepID=A0A972FWI8_9FLAO|nr:S41 family peptidase [Flavobacterium silvaticum]NMH29317.1 hypothetical protein [Flavobacterium silvaticum]